MANPYYNPEECGLEIIASIDYSSRDYEFDTRVVWVDKNGKFLTARDSGCSCPTPFEWYEDGKNLVKMVLSQLREEIKEELAKDGRGYITPQEAQEFLRTVEVERKKRKAIKSDK